MDVTVDVDDQRHILLNNLYAPQKQRTTGGLPGFAVAWLVHVHGYVHVHVENRKLPRMSGQVAPLLPSALPQLLTRPLVDGA